MRCAAAVLIASLLIAISAASGEAQEDPFQEDLVQGDRVRVSAAFGSTEGLLNSANEREIRVADEAGRVSVFAWNEVERIEVHRGKRRATSEGFAYAVLGGAALGAVLGFLWPSCVDSCGLGVRAEDAVHNGAVLGGLGLLIGPLVGTFIMIDDWEILGLPVEPTLFPVVDGVGFSLFVGG